MKELVVISGKGGTGKTTVVAALATLARPAVLADCDVDAADLHLLLAPRIRLREVFVSGRTAVIRQEACAHCGICHIHCRFDAISVERDGSGIPTFQVDPISCEGCGVCVHHCPEGAIDFPKNTCGEWFISDTRHGPMVHARMGIAEENSGKLVTLVRSQARRIAGERRIETLIVDGPPGIGCPVIASITGAALVLIVTEPSKAAIHDLKRVLQLVEQLGISAAVCVNKCDINADMAEAIEGECHHRSVPVIARIPYSDEVTQAMIAETSVIEHRVSPVASEITAAWQWIQSTLQLNGRRGETSRCPAQ